MTRDRLRLMDERLKHIGDSSPADAVCEIVQDLFGFDYDIVPILRGKREDLSNREVLAEELAKLPALTGEDVRPLLLHLFGTNLEGIVAIESAPISIRSKENWVKRHKGDLVLISGGHEDLDVLVTPTEEYVAVTGSEQLPEVLLERLVEIGYENRDGHAFHVEPGGGPIPDSFKQLTIRTITEYFEENPVG